MDSFYTLPEVCRILKIKRGTLHSLIGQGKIKAFYITPGKRAIKKEELEKYMKKHGLKIEQKWRIEGKLNGKEIEINSEDINGLKKMLTWIKRQTNSDGIITRI